MGADGKHGSVLAALLVTVLIVVRDTRPPQRRWRLHCEGEVASEACRARRRTQPLLAEALSFASRPFLTRLASSQLFVAIAAVYVRRQLVKERERHAREALLLEDDDEHPLNSLEDALLLPSQHLEPAAELTL